jgi:hypothetical protein
MVGGQPSEETIDGVEALLAGHLYVRREQGGHGLPVVTVLEGSLEPTLQTV